ncbi:MAG: hypothetical protein NC417_02970 [Candidatus Gastranaerophilales bacterium]|nr:hypothetical protein [Candidatus Gastranaerophilales bacterium]
MSRRILELSNLVELVENGTISITSVESKTKDISSITKTGHITPERFKESLQYLNEAALFRNAIDFFYEFRERNGIHIETAMKNPYLDEYFYVDCEIKDGVSMDYIDKKFRETIFDRLEKKIAS